MKLLKTIMLASLLIAVTACSSAVEPVPEYNFDSQELSFDGAEFNLLMANDYIMDDDSVLGYIGNTVFADSALKRITDIEEKYAVDFSVIYVVRASDTVKNAVISASDSYDMVWEETYYNSENYRAGIFIDLLLYGDYINCLDTEKWGGKYLIESSAWNGGVYAVVPMQYPIISLNSANGVIAINEDMIKYLNTEDPREYYENGEWTWTTFDSVLPIYYHDSPSSSEKIKAMVTNREWFIRSMIMTNTEEIFFKDSAGEYRINIYTDAGTEAAIKTWDYVFGQYKEYFDFGVSDTKRLAEYFSEGKAVLANVDSYQIMAKSDSIAYTVENFGIVPFPTGPDIEPGTVISTYEAVDYAASIPISVKSPEMSAAVIDSLFEPFEGYETRESIVSYLTQYFLCDVRDADIFIKLTENMQNFYYGYKVIEALPQFTADKSATETLDKYKTASYENLKEDVVPAKETIAALFTEDE